MEIAPHPQVELTQLYPGAPAPVKADRALSGSIPLRAWQHCEPLMAASGWGFWMYPPFLMALLYDGTDIYWTRLDDPDASDAEPEWFMQGIPYPGFADRWSEHIPDMDPPGLVSMAEPGLVQLFPGVIGNTAPGWSMYLSAAINIPERQGYEVLAGIIETDWYGGPLAPVLRLTKIDEPIVLRADVPLFSAVPVPRSAYMSELGTVVDAEPRHFEMIRESLAPRNIDAETGGYRRRTRRRARTEAGQPSAS